MGGGRVSERWKISILFYDSVASLVWRPSCVGVKLKDDILIFLSFFLSLAS